jgi:hypothetical protein
VLGVTLWTYFEFGGWYQPFALQCVHACFPTIIPAPAHTLQTLQNLHGFPAGLSCGIWLSWTNPNELQTGQEPLKWFSAGVVGVNFSEDDCFFDNFECFEEVVLDCLEEVEFAVLLKFISTTPASLQSGHVLQ